MDFLEKKVVSRETCARVAPYAAWMALMTALPTTAEMYAVRGGVTAALLLLGGAFGCFHPTARSAAAWARAAGVGALAGLAVFAIWVAPDLLFPSAAASAPSPYAPTVCGWPLTVAKLAASAFVIPVAEELFFRKWLVEFAGFWWMVILFAVEHGDRWHVGAVAGLVYGLLARRLGLFAAIVAHVVTNLVLGLYVIRCGQWQFW